MLCKVIYDVCFLDNPVLTDVKIILKIYEEHRQFYYHLYIYFESCSGEYPDRKSNKCLKTMGFSESFFSNCFPRNSVLSCFELWDRNGHTKRLMNPSSVRPLDVSNRLRHDGQWLVGGSGRDRSRNTTIKRTVVMDRLYFYVYAKVAPRNVSTTAVSRSGL